MNRTIRQAIPADTDGIMSVMAAARQTMRASGNPHQWTDGYPSEIVIASDMEKRGGFVMVEKEKVVAYFAFLPSPEPTYKKIYGGRWLDDSLSYHVIHRIASYPDVHHVFSDIMEYVFSLSDNIRIDTHRDNHIMQHNITKHGFTYCGIIHLASGDERLAYQKIRPHSNNRI
ncbi:MAG: N-acetyltransferase [Prevotella sp.]|nr:N-acetyltransferase [Prevotella sp.]